MNSRFLSILATALIINCTCALAPANAQTADQIAILQQIQVQAAASADLLSRFQQTHDVLVEFIGSKDHFLSSADFDECLKMLVRKVNLLTPDPNMSIQNSGKYKTYYQYAIASDDSYIPIVNGMPKLPDYTSGPQNTIVIHTSENRCWGWVAGSDGKPAMLKGGPLYFEINK